MSSDIAQIIDTTAAIAAGIEGVVAAFGAGTGLVEDPLRVGRQIQTAESNPVAAYTHWSEVPAAPGVTWLTQNKTVEVMWTVPMRLWLPHDPAAARLAAIPFYDRYLGAFVRDNTLGGLANRTHIARFAIGGDKDWSWLDVGLVVVEIINYGV